MKYLYKFTENKDVFNQCGATLFDEEGNGFRLTTIIQRGDLIIPLDMFTRPKEIKNEELYSKSAKSSLIKILHKDKIYYLAIKWFNSIYLKRLEDK